MTNEGFLLSYGGAGGEWYTTDPDEIHALDKACKEDYGPPQRSVRLSIHGLDITVLSYGLHRAVHVQLPLISSAQTDALYRQLCATASALRESEYSILSNNCVTAVTAILHQIDPDLAPPYLVFPWTLDQAIKTYQHQHVLTGFLRPFFELYQQKISENQYFSFASTRAKLREIKSLQDVLLQAYQGEQCERERTKSSLLELKWVTEDEQGLLHPTLKAPLDFRIGLIEFNYDYQAVLMLKEIAQSHGMAPKALEALFLDNPDYETALEQIKQYFMPHAPTVFADITFRMEIWHHAQEQNQDMYEIEDLPPEDDDNRFEN